MHRHKWGEIGLVYGCVVSRPCLVGYCEAELRHHHTPQGWHGSGRRKIVPDGYPSVINGIRLKIKDHWRGGVAKIVMREIVESYRLDKIDFQPGDVVIDIGAHVGVVSIYLALKCPGLHILAFEPSPTNYDNLLYNIWQNRAQGITPVNAAAVRSGKSFKLATNDRTNTGGGSGYTRGKQKRVPALTLDAIFEQYQIERCKLLKLDCEGAEYDIITGASEEALKRVEYVTGELHTNRQLAERGFGLYSLEEALTHYIDPKKITVHGCRIAE